MRLRSHLLAAVALAVVAVGTILAIWARGLHRAVDRRPNIVLISLDTTRPDHLGCYGYGKPTSPHLDRLAEAGVRFATARAQATFTLPSHMALFTSLLPSHSGLEALN